MIDSALGRIPFANFKATRSLLVVSLLVMSAILGQATPTFHLASFDLFTLVIAGLAGAAFLFLTLRDLQFGLFVIVLAAFFVRFGLGTGSATRIPSSMILTALMVGLWIVVMLVRKRVHLVPSPVNVPLLGFVVVCLVSLPWSWLFARPELFLVSSGSGTPFQIVQFGGLALMVLLPLLFLMGLNVMRERRWILATFAVIVFVGVVALIANLLHLPQYFGSFSINTGGLFSLWIISLTSAQVIFNDQLKKWQRLLLGLLCLGWIYYQFGLGTTWFSGWMPAMLAVLFLTYRKSKKAVLIVLAAIAIAFLFDPIYFYNRIWVKAQAMDFNRFTIWPTVISLTLTHTSALFGSGPVGYIPLYRTFVFGQAWSSHNNYVDIFAETGIVGFGFFLWFLFETFKTGWRHDSQISDGFLRAFNNGALAALVGTIFAMMLGDWFIPFVYNQGYPGFDFNAYVWILLGAMVGLQSLSPGARPTEAPSPAITSATAATPQSGRMNLPREREMG